MNSDFSADVPPALTAPDAELPTLGMSSVYRLFEAFIGLRERNERQHKLFDQTLTRTRDALQNSFNSFVAETQKAYQQLRQELHADKRISLALLSELLEADLDLARIVAARPAVPLGPEEDAALQRWMDAVEVQSRKIHTALEKQGIYRYHAVVGALYNPALHERVGSRRVEGLDALRVAEQCQHGYASQQPDFVLRRPKVMVTE